jgi:hypothetical protein
MSYNELINLVSEPVSFILNGMIYLHLDTHESGVLEVH